MVDEYIPTVPCAEVLTETSALKGSLITGILISIFDKPRPRKDLCSQCFLVISVLRAKGQPAVPFHSVAGCRPGPGVLCPGGLRVSSDVFFTCNFSTIAEDRRIY